MGVKLHLSNKDIKILLQSKHTPYACLHYKALAANYIFCELNLREHLENGDMYLKGGIVFVGLH